MKSSYYGSMKDIIKNRASGYQDRNGFVNADYLSLTLPYAAGSIMSTVDDLLIWQNAISANKLIKQSSLDKAINGSILNSGEKIPQRIPILLLCHYLLRLSSRQKGVIIVETESLS